MPMKILYTLIALIVVGGGAWYLMRGTVEAPTQDSDRAQTNEVPAAASDEQNFSGSMQELMARGGSWTCDVSSTAGGVTSSGTTYVANGMVRSDFTSEIPQVGNIESHMIVRDGLAYTWTSMMNQGFKFPISQAEGEAEVSAEVAAQVSQDYDFSCSPWAVDVSRFALPSGITF